MDRIGIRELRQNASRVVASVAAGEILTITDRGRPVARMTPLCASSSQDLIDAGLARPAKRLLHELTAPAPGPPLSGVVEKARSAERY